METKDINRSTVIVFHCLGWGVILFVAAMFLYGMLSGDSGGKMILKQAYPIYFKGKVDSVYYDRPNHNVKTLILSDGAVYGLYSDWEQFVDKDDSIEKKVSSFVVTVRKPSGRVIVLDYRKLRIVVNDK